MIDERRKHFSAMVRQIRCKANNRKHPHDLPLELVHAILLENEGLCDLCNAGGTVTLRLAVPEAPWVVANLLLCCASCSKVYTEYEGLLDLVAHNKVTWERYVEVLTRMMKREGAELLKPAIRRLTGLED